MRPSTTSTIDPVAGSTRMLPALLDVREVARLINTSTKTVYRLTDAGKMPRPVKLGALVRWKADELREWINAGCPNVSAEVAHAS